MEYSELSGMTYLSYFMNKGSPGYKATLRWVQSQIPEENVSNFTADWNDGRCVGGLVRSLGGNVPGFANQTYDRASWEDNLARGMKGGRGLGVEPVLTPKQMAESEDEHLGIMAYAAWFQWVDPRPLKSGAQKISLSGDGLNRAFCHRPAHFQVTFLEEVNSNDIRAELRSPTGQVIPVKFRFQPGGASATYTASESGPHELFVWCEGELVESCPRKVQVHADLSRVTANM